MVTDLGDSDIFVHYDDLLKASINKEIIKKNRDKGN